MIYSFCLKLHKFILIGIISLISTIGCAKKMNFTELSNKIYKRNGGVGDKSTFKLNSHHRTARMKVYQLDRASFLKRKIDTLYILEGYNIETATFSGTIWNKRNSVSYSCFNGYLTLENRSGFTNYQMQLITSWDTVGVRISEKINGNWLDNNRWINALRCSKKGKDWQIDEIYFKNFYDPKRDR